MATFFNIIGLAGVGAMLLAYYLLQQGKVGPHDSRYLWLNLIGALAVVLSLVEDWNLPAFVIEACWVAISAHGLWKLRARRQP